MYASSSRPFFWTSCRFLPSSSVLTIVDGLLTCNLTIVLSCRKVTDGYVPWMSLAGSRGASSRDRWLAIGGGSMNLRSSSPYTENRLRPLSQVVPPSLLMAVDSR